MRDLCLDDYTKFPEHQAIQRDIDRFLAGGGVIERLPYGASGMIDGLYGSVGAQIRKNKAMAKARRAQMQDDADDGETEY